MIKLFLNFIDIGYIFWKNIRNAIELDNALENFQVLFAYSSNHIEMPEVTYNFRGDIKNLFAIKNQKTCYLYLRDRIVKKEKIKC